MKKMNKIFSILFLSLMVMLPMTTHAATNSINYNCTKTEENTYHCTVTYKFENPTDSVTVSLTEEGGAEVTPDSIKSNDETWVIASGDDAKVNNVWTLDLVSLSSVTGEGDLFEFSYKASGSADCKIRIKLDDTTLTVTPNDPAPSNPSNPDEKEDSKQTGATLPYVALGVIVVGATGLYLATRNKSKMYKI